MNIRLAKLMRAMVAHDRGDAGLVHHFLKVHNLCRTMGILEGMAGMELEALEAAAILHDIGILTSRAKYGSSAGPYQEKEGPPEAEELLRAVGGFDEVLIERVKFLVGHHHTYTNVEGLDYQILVEADFLVNLLDHRERYGAILAAQKNIFRTEAGLALLHDMYAGAFDPAVEG